MKKFILKIFALIILLFISLVLVFTFHACVIGNQYDDEYIGAFYTKMEKLSELKNDGTPKIIIVGDSSSAFGFKCEYIEEAFDMPVINLGLHAGLGIAFHEEMAKCGINEGDIVVLCPYGYSDSTKIVDYRLAWTAIDLHREYWQVISKENRFNMALAYPNYFFNSLYKWLDDLGNSTQEGMISSESKFNSYGDISITRPNATDNIYFMEGKIEIPQIDEDRANQINEFNKYVNSKGAILVIASYPIGYVGEIDESQLEELSGFREKIQEMVDCKVISNYEDYLFSYKYFYDTYLHLTDEGAYLRTQLLIKELGEELEIKM